MEHAMAVEFDHVVEGFAVDLYAFVPSLGLKMSKLSTYVADIELVCGVEGVRILAPIPNSTLIGFEIPKKDRKFPSEMPKTEGFELNIGVETMGNVKTFDIRKAPHLLVAGATGSGKSVFLNSIIKQLIKIPNSDLHLFDPKIVELSQFKKDAIEYYTENQDIYLALSELVNVMNGRYKKLGDAGVRNIDEFLKKGGQMRYKFVVIDEFG